MHHAAYDEKIDELRRLLNSNDVDDVIIDIDDANNAKQLTPLMIAASKGNVDAIQLLLDHGAHINKHASNT